MFRYFGGNPVKRMETLRTITDTTRMIPTFDAARTAQLVPYDCLVDTLAATMLDYAAGRIESPERMVVPLSQGGVMLSMPATASDLAMHKLVNVCPGNGALGLPTIHGQVTAFDAITGVPQFMLDSPTVTGRRTVAVSMLAVRALALHPPQDVLLIGTGKQAAYHLEALASVYPDARHSGIHVLGSKAERARAFCAAHADVSPQLAALDNPAIPDAIDVVIATTTSKTPVYTLPARAGRLVIGVGAFTVDVAEIAAPTVLASTRYVDDLAGARHEAGDYILAGVGWDTVLPFAQALTSPKEIAGPVMLKLIGCAAWEGSRGMPRGARGFVG
ncbi:Ornithine cyclodeaminase [Candidatus Burkholderia brachyanthoides]|nr:Ornithine cyclodeaminase [Candidatus Burkholderia brachyanthoides]